MAEEVTSTGIPKLDELLMDGIPRGFTVLIEGSPGSGMELFAKQFAAAGVGNENVVYFPTNETTEDLIGTMKRFNWPTDIKVVNIATEYYEKVLAKELEASRLKQEGLSIVEISKFTGVPGERETVNFLTAIVYEISKLKPPYRIVIDSLDFFLEHYPHKDVLSALRTIKAHTQYNNGLALFTIVKDAYDKNLESAVEATVDVVLELEILRMAQEFENRLVIKKVKNRPEKAAILIYAITEAGVTPEMVTRVA